MAHQICARKVLTITKMARISVAPGRFDHCGKLLEKREGNIMDDTAHAAHTALHQRFDALKAELDQIHTAWQQAVVARNFARQRALIAEERVLIAKAHTILEAFRANWARLHPEEDEQRRP